MKRIGFPSAIALVVLSTLFATLLKVKELWSVGHIASHGRDVTREELAARGQEGADSLSFIQGTPHVSLLGQRDQTPSLSAMPQQTRPKPHAGPSTISILENGAHIRLAASTWRDALRSSSSAFLEKARRRMLGEMHLSSTSSVSGSTWIVTVLLLGLVIATFIVVQQGLRRQTSAAEPKDSPRPGHRTGLMQEVFEPMRSSSAPMRSASVPRSDSRLSAASRHSRMPQQPDDNTFGLRPWSPLPSAVTPMGSMAHMMPPSILAPPTMPQAPPYEVAPVADRGGLPPPLCPNVVLPNCEVRVGVSMHELGKMSPEGELTIVGLSGNPLLRATLKKTEAGRTLEISMPEPRSAPRAIVGPTFQEVVGPSKQKSRAVQICGMKGAFYGMLEMRSSGACYVIKDGQTVLIIDGDSDSLQLSIKSGEGLALASVTCSSEPFGGAEHVEIRVQPGVDTVLVLACVLSVVLLSPYPPSDQQ